MLCITKLLFILQATGGGVVGLVCLAVVTLPGLNHKVKVSKPVIRFTFSFLWSWNTTHPHHGVKNSVCKNHVTQYMVDVNVNLAA